jgi:hypothetical protein
MKRTPYIFMLKGLAIMSPVWCFIVLSEVFLAISGESTSIREVALRHLPGSYYPMFFGSQFRRLHLERIVRLRPKVLVLGSSRVERFRSEMFDPEAGFYNACQTIRSVGSLQSFVDLLPPDYVPEAIILGVDCWWLNRAATPDSALEDLQDEVRRDDTRMVNAHLQAFQRLAITVRERNVRPAVYEQIFSRADGGIQRYGVGAWSEGGYRNDGSYQPLERKTSDIYHSDLPDTYQGVMEKAPRKRGLTPAAAADPQLLHQLETTLQALAKRGTCIVGFAPPYDSATLKFFADHPAEYGVLQDFRRRLPQMFQANGWSFYDGTDPASLGLDDRCMQELYHALETYHVALLRRFAENAVVARALHLDLSYLDALLQDARTTPAYPFYPDAREKAVAAAASF